MIYIAQLNNTPSKHFAKQLHIVKKTRTKGEKDTVGLVLIKKKLKKKKKTGKTKKAKRTILNSRSIFGR